MNKPDWKDAPEWANWLAMDENGEWYWYQYKPIEPYLTSDESKESGVVSNWTTKSGKWTSCERWAAITSLEKRAE